jgi:predicted DNA-binding protein (MmcQ/YjbR family)
MSFPGAKEEMPWEDHLAFKVGGKIFLIYNLGKLNSNRLSLKCTPEKFVIGQAEISSLHLPGGING